MRHGTQVHASASHQEMGLHSPPHTAPTYPMSDLWLPVDMCPELGIPSHLGLVLLTKAEAARAGHGIRPAWGLALGPCQHCCLVTV